VDNADVSSNCFVALLHFKGHLGYAKHFPKLKGYMPQMLGNPDFVSGCTI
jgi:hypothetical protein